jgi:nicotinate phosphoribosyltransferase
MKSRYNNVGLLTDLYELTMAASYFENHMAAPATFSLFIRSFPPGRGYFVAAGLEDVLQCLEGFHFSDTDIAYLDGTGLFSDDFLHYLAKIRFTGSVQALAEGEVFFIDEPILEITAPIIEAQILETLVINIVNLQTMVATKAARCVYGAQGRNLVDFSLRRTQGGEAGMKVARSSYLAGFAGTSNVLAGKTYQIPISGTMAHSYVTAFGDELAAFRAFVRSFPQNAVLLIDTYDTVAGARKAALVGREMAEQGGRMLGVRLDSGDMAQLSQQVRDILDRAGLKDTQIFASGNFDEYKITKTLREGARIDAYGVGTQMGVSSDAPYLDMVYKLVQYDGRPMMKLSAGKTTLPGPKQVFRYTDSQGRFLKDVIGLREERVGHTEPLLEKVMKDGKCLQPHPTLERMRENFQERFSRLDGAHKRLDDPVRYPVTISERLQALQREEEKRIQKELLGKS